MKRILFVTVVMIFLATGQLYGMMGYSLDMFVFSADGSSGTATPLSDNGYAWVNAYRIGIAGQIGHEERQVSDDDETITQMLYTPNYDDDGAPAELLTDVGSSQWTADEAVGQTVVAVAEVYDPQFGYTGPSEVACGVAVITEDNLVGQNGGGMVLPDTQLKFIPTPSIVQQGIGSIIVGWTGIDLDNISGYTLYRATSASGSYSMVTVTAQNRNGSIQYTDSSSLVYGTTYYYEISVNFTWGGGGGAPAYYETNARSQASGSGEVATYTATPTATCTFTPTMTPTPTFTPTPYVSIVKSIANDGRKFTLGDTITYCIYVTNNSGYPITFNIWDTMPSVLAYAGGNSGCAHTGAEPDVIYWSGITLDGGQSTGDYCFWGTVKSYH